jgi:integrase
VAVADLGWREGRRDRREFTGPTKRAAEERRDAFLHRRRDGFTLPKGRPLYVAEWLKHWLHQVIRGRVEETTWHKSYRPAIEDYAMPFFARIRLPELTREDVEAWHAWLARKKGRKGPYLSAATIRNAHRALSMALKEAAARDLLLRNPCAGVRLPRARQAEISPPSPEQVRLILEACRTWPGGARWVLALATGIRQGEALALQWRDVKLDGPQPSVRIRQSRARVAGEWVVKPPKSAKSRRTVPLPAAAVAALRAHRAAQTVTSLDGLVFTNRRGEPVHAPADWRDWQRLLASLGLPRWRVHDARHATATQLLKQGVPVRVVQEILGHSSASVTQNVYQHVTAEMMAQAASALDEALGE